MLKNWIIGFQMKEVLARIIKITVGELYFKKVLATNATN